MPTTTHTKRPTAQTKRPTRHKKTGSRYMDSAIELERKFAGMTRQEWLKSLIDRQADLTYKVLHR